MMPRIGKSYQFEAAHFLPLVPDGHKCKRLHGHNYRVEVELSGTLDAQGMVLDFGALDLVMENFLRLVDHRLLNDVPGLENPTAELIAKWFSKRIKDTLSRACIVRVYENDDCWAEIAGC
jgi:6-pyruvoyltetrahydropterin/6-carboxytetrahydropterin synthase